LKLFSQAIVAIDGSKFKAVNTRDRNFTAGKVKKQKEQIEESIKRYLDALDTADRTLAPAELQVKSKQLQDKLKTMRQQMRRMKRIERRLKEGPDGQISLTDSDARSMATSGRGSGIVGYNVQTAVDAKHHLIVAHEVTNEGHDRAQLARRSSARRLLCQGAERESRPLARPGIRRERIGKARHRPRLVLLQHALNDCRYPGKVQPPAKEGGHCDFVRRIEHRRHRTPLASR
jgi:hypothetical protein